MVTNITLLDLKLPSCKIPREYTYLLYRIPYAVKYAKILKYIVQKLMDSEIREQFSNHIVEKKCNIVIILKTCKKTIAGVRNVMLLFQKRRRDEPWFEQE